ncbi:MAG: HlyD family efflux transporter periplasmic adaptor subunit [Candidatus Eremiobacteraeota bacterium]|nr:HlyD family efflux transporter periplasmic adaptor subunit [Candidatus Eremiobacteraeota bacterium]
MDKNRIIQLVLMAIFIGLMLVAGCNFIKELQGEKKESKTIIDVSGRIEGDQFNAGAKVTGKVDRLLVDEGDTVKRGQLLGSIYSEQLKASVDSAKKEVEIWKSRIIQSESALEQAKARTHASVNQAEAGLNVNTSQLNKAQALYKQSVAQLDQSVLAVRQAELDHAQAGASLKKAKANLDYNDKEFQRYKNLLKEDAIPKTKYDAVETQYITAREDFVLAKKQVDKALTAIDTAKKNLNVANANVNIGIAGIKEGASSVEAGRANVNLAQVGSYDIEQREKDVKMAHQSLAKAQDALKSALADLEDSRVYAPIDGSVINKIVEPGEVIAGGTPLVTVVDLNKLYLRAFMPTERRDRIKIGNAVKITPDGLDQSFEGVVYKISDKNEFTPKNVETKDQRTKLVFSVKIRILDNKEKKLTPGMPCEAQIDTARNISTEGLDKPEK